jgi:uncharacterized membrane protein
MFVVAFCCALLTSMAPPVQNTISPHGNSAVLVAALCGTFGSVIFLLAIGVAVIYLAQRRHYNDPNDVRAPVSL